MEDVLYVPGTWETDENVKLLYTLYRYVTYDHFILNRFSLLNLFAYMVICEIKDLVHSLILLILFQNKRFNAIIN